MTKCPIISACYYINDKQFTHNDMSDLINDINSTEESLKFSNVDKLVKLLEGLNTRLVDRQSLSLEAAIKKAEDENFYSNLDKSDISVVAGSFSSALYPMSSFVLSAKKGGPNFVNATEFTNTVGNAAASRVCIWNQFRSKVYSLAEGLNAGLNSVVNVFDDIRYKNMKIAFACATEEIGSAAILLQQEGTITKENQPIAYISDCDSRYVGNINDIKEYLKRLENKFKINFEDADIYLSGNFNNIDEVFKKENIKIKSRINKKMWSLTPLIDIGRCLYEYKNGSTKDSVVFSIDAEGFVSAVHITR